MIFPNLPSYIYLEIKMMHLMLLFLIRLRLKINLVEKSRRLDLLYSRESNRVPERKKKKDIEGNDKFHVN